MRLCEKEGETDGERGKPGELCGPVLGSVCVCVCVMAALHPPEGLVTRLAH